MVAGAAPSARSNDCEARRRFRRAAAIGGLLATPIFYWMVTAGRLNPLHAEPFGNLYDVQARSLLRGHWTVPTKQVAFEGFRVHGKTYVYFGPVPAIFRFPVLAITHSLDGRLTQVSMLAAFAVALVFVARLSGRIRWLVRGADPVSTLELWCVGAYVFLIGTGSVILFLGSRALVYHEAELWGVALALGAYDAILDFLADPSRRAVVLAAVWSSLAFLTRASVGAGPVIALGIVLAATLLRYVAARIPRDDRWAIERALRSPARWLAVPPAAGRRSVLASLAAATAAPVALYGYVNEARFGTLFSLPLDKQIYTRLSAVRRHALAANGGSLFGVKFMPTQLVQFLRPDALRFQSVFPWVNFPRAATVVGHVIFDTRDWSSSGPSSMPLLTVLGLVGLGIILVRRHRPAVANGADATRAPLLGAVAGGLITLTIAFVANRYLSDFLPAIVLVSLVGLHWLLGIGARRAAPRWIRTVGFTLLVLAVSSLWINFALAIDYQRLLFPAQGMERVGFIGFQLDVDRWLPGGPRLRPHTGPELPAVGGLAELFIVGHCGGLYWSDSRQWFAIERANSTGHFRLRARFPSTSLEQPEALVSIGSTTDSNTLVVELITPTRAQFLVDSGRETVRISKPATVHPGGTDLIDVVLDHRVHAARVSVDGRVVLDELTSLMPGNKAVIGGTDAADRPRFSGTIDSLPVRTPLCDSLRRRSAR